MSLSFMLVQLHAETLGLRRILTRSEHVGWFLLFWHMMSLQRAERQNAMVRFAHDFLVFLVRLEKRGLRGSMDTLLMARYLRTPRIALVRFICGWGLGEGGNASRIRPPGLFRMLMNFNPNFKHAP